MTNTTPNPVRPREWRRRVALEARVRWGTQWSGGQIVNISSRGMQMHCARTLPVGSLIEVRQDDQMVSAVVIWTNGPRAGLSCLAPIRVGDWIATSAELRPSQGERRRHPRSAAVQSSEDDARQSGRKLEFGATVAVAATIAGLAAALAVSTLSSALAPVAAAIGG